MNDKLYFNQSNLVLNVSQFYDPNKLNLNDWEEYLEILCGDRDYQKEAIKNSVIYLASDKYKNLKDLVSENYDINPELRRKYYTIEKYYEHLQIRDKLFANIDLATGTGKSYVMFGIAQIALSIGLVEKVLVLCPSRTIENGLKKKFIELASDKNLRDTIPNTSFTVYPQIIDANQTINSGDICVENIHAVYENTGSSIKDSFNKGGEKTLVLNDESHHIFNKITGISPNSKEGENIKKWKGFLLNPNYNFKYILGFTGTAYIENDYFNDVIYRYSLKDAIKDRVVKSIDYVQKDDLTSKTYEKFQKILINHNENKRKYNLVKPLTILITKDINKAINLYEDLVDFLAEEENLDRSHLENKVLIVTSHKKHEQNLKNLEKVDDKNNSVEWIISVSMLTEGWDVKNVFQIVPWEDRAFNSKLLISQVLGRGLRVPNEYQNPQPIVTVFNHDNWSKNIRSLVEEVLEIETRIRPRVVREQYNFDIYNIKYHKEEIEVDAENSKSINYKNMWQHGIKLISQVDATEKNTVYYNLNGEKEYTKSYLVKNKQKHVDEIINKILHEFRIRDWESDILGLDDGQVYSKENLPPRDTIKNIILKSMRKVGIESEYLTEDNSQRIFSAFSTLFRKRSTTLVSKVIEKDLILISTGNIRVPSSSISNFRKDHTFFYTDQYIKEIIDDEQKKIVIDFLEDESFSKGSQKIINSYSFKTNTNFVISSGEPEKKFILNLCDEKNAKLIDCWSKSSDTGFYGIDYSYRIGSHSKQKRFNPDFFIKCSNDGMEYIIVVEIKDDNDVSVKNKAKYTYGTKHFRGLNELLQKENINQKYMFHFLSPEDYPIFFEYLRTGKIFTTDTDSKFKGMLETKLEENNY
ncbi:restriction endonuclease subunit R [Macrococcoides caseolyticum]|uniref:DEAD/DEAH box helicase n=1 Tax=Macrococcoides caseolyticum TaxID=69966 RepID=UPI000C329A6D|nr:DEAD/DEAH box helicase family protein [Macrococcus caseolyticus]PKE67153.1 restriction endonuclease subunit R [Macrococcus caseolyticus]